MENYLKNKGTLYDANSNINRFNRSNVNDVRFFRFNKQRKFTSNTSQAGYNIISNAPLNSQLKTTNYNKVAGGENKNLRKKYIINYLCMIACSIQTQQLISSFKKYKSKYFESYKQFKRNFE